MYKLFEDLLKSRGTRVSDVAKATGIRPSTFTDWKKGLYTPKSDKLQKIANYFSVPISYFYPDMNNAAPINNVSEKVYQVTEFQYQIIQAFEALSSDAQDIILNSLKLSRPDEGLKEKETHSA